MPGREKIYQKNRLENIFAYIEEQLRNQDVFYPKDVILGHIQDDGLNLMFTFADKDGYVSVTMPDKLIVDQDRDLEEEMLTDRVKFVKILRDFITDCLEKLKNHDRKTFIKPIRGDIDFSEPVCPEVELRLRELAMDLVKDQSHFYTYINVEYLNSLGSPVYVYNLIKFLIPVARAKGLRIPQSVMSSLSDPQYYLNPHYITERLNKELNEEDS